jgi:hypothetical protein
VNPAKKRQAITAMAAQAEVGQARAALGSNLQGRSRAPHAKRRVTRGSHRHPRNNRKDQLNMSECKPRKVEHLARIEGAKGANSISIAICEDTSEGGTLRRCLVATHHDHKSGKCAEIMNIRLPSIGHLVIGPAN